MQYGLAIIFETQLSHKTGVLISDFGLRIKTMENSNRRFTKTGFRTLELGKIRKNRPSRLFNDEGGRLERKG
jgi:hypothetical protein